MPRSRELGLRWVLYYVGPHDRPRLSWHRHWELAVVCAGQATLYSPGLTLPLHRGSAVLIPPGISHREDATHFEVVWIGLEGSRLAGLDPRGVMLSFSDELPAVAETLWRRVGRSTGTTGMEAEGLATTALGLFLRGAEDQPGPGDAIDQAVDLLHRRLATCPPITQLAAQAGMSESYFFRSFRRRTGQTPRAYLARIRLDRAQALLRCSSLTVAEVARQVGYADPLYFSRAFRRAFGRPPSAR